MAPPAELPWFVFDGDCGFCRRWAAWVERRIDGQATFAPYQSVDLPALGLTAAEVQTASYWVAEDGRRFRGTGPSPRPSSGVAGAWRWLGIVGDLPGPRWVAAAVYRVVVRNRHRLPAPRG